jgi:hypothetical protein
LAVVVTEGLYGATLARITFPENEPSVHPTRKDVIRMLLISEFDLYGLMTKLLMQAFVTDANPKLSIKKGASFVAFDVNAHEFDSVASFSEKILEYGQDGPNATMISGSVIDTFKKYFRPLDFREKFVFLFQCQCTRK